ncbi:MAG: hypothetical protein M3P14_00460 [Chloroflexota bacterium]|nr:hypothetical protein [Chloroflexota bacterium]
MTGVPAVAATSPSPTAAPVAAGDGAGRPSAMAPLLLGILAAGLLAGLGVLLLTGRRRREPDDEEAAVELAAEQPTAARRRLDPAGRGEDPILAAMGIGATPSEEVIGDALASVAAPITRQVPVGGERPSRRPAWHPRGGGPPSS